MQYSAPLGISELEEVEDIRNRNQVLCNTSLYDPWRHCTVCDVITDLRILCSHIGNWWVTHSRQQTPTLHGTFPVSEYTVVIRQEMDVVITVSYSDWPSRRSQTGNTESGAIRV